VIEQKDEKFVVGVGLTAATSKKFIGRCAPGPAPPPIFNLLHDTEREWFVPTQGIVGAAVILQHADLPVSHAEIQDPESPTHLLQTH
jgi:hypothetical protein